MYEPQDDTWLLADALRQVPIGPGHRVLDIGTGTGVLACLAVDAGASDVTAIDVCESAVASAKLNSALRGYPIRVLQASFADLPLDEQFDVVIANPPYVPYEEGVDRLTSTAWDAGADGRSVLDPLCARVSMLLAPEGRLLLVHSALCGAEQTIAALAAGGMTASVVARELIPFGPVMRGRRDRLLRQGLLEYDQELEEIVVISATRTGATERAA